MNENELKEGRDGVSNNQVDWDVETLTEQIFTELKGAFTHAMIREVISELAPKYESARIQLYVPILIRREAIDQLQTIKARYPPQRMGINEAGKGIDSRANSDSSPRRIVRVMNKIRQLIVELETP